MLIVVQINMMFMTDLPWWQCSLNFLIVWAVHLYNLGRIPTSKILADFDYFFFSEPSIDGSCIIHQLNVPLLKNIDL
jgi:hypothetical protein